MPTKPLCLLGKMKIWTYKDIRCDRNDLRILEIKTPTGKIIERRVIAYRGVPVHDMHSSVSVVRSRGTNSKFINFNKRE